jgi:multiple sugar transport system permease protein
VRPPSGRNRARKAAVYVGLIVGGLAMMIPFIWMLSTSLKTRAEVFATPPFSFPTGLHWENYTKMWFALPGVTFGTFFGNSIVIA